MKSNLALPSLFIGMALSTAVDADLQPIEEAGLESVTGEGLAILPENFRLQFQATDYIRSIPRGAPSFGRAADLLWYGFAFSGANGDLTQRVSTTDSGAVSDGRIDSWGNAGNPWVFLATSPTRLLYNGTNTAYPVLQYKAPVFQSGTSNTTGDFVSSSVMNLKYAFYGDIVVCGAGIPGYNSTAACGIGGTNTAGTGISSITSKLQSFSVWDGFSFHGSVYNIFQSTVDYGKYLGSSGTEFVAVSGTNQGTFGAVWLNRINSNTTGVLRFAVAQTGATTGTTNVPETVNLDGAFNANEGVYVTDLDINMVVGHLHYQPIIFDNDANGNLVIEVVRIPNNSTVYNYAYRDYSSTTAAQLAKMCTNSTLDCASQGAVSQDATHGEVHMGNVTFKNSAGTAVDLGSADFQGLFIQHLKIRTLGL